MIRLQYFARYRETLGLDAEQLEWNPSWRQVGDLRDTLLTRGGAWQVLAEQNVMCARNDEMCALDEPLADGDEVAFFPTVTGG